MNFDWFNKTFRSKGIIVLGPKASGKTQFLSCLGANTIVGIQTSTDPYDSFCVKSGKTKIFIKKGTDWGGGKFDVAFQLALKSKFVFYIVDGDKYFNDWHDPESKSDIGYQRMVNGELDTLRRNSSLAVFRNIFIVLTHIETYLKNEDERQIAAKFKHICAKGKNFSNTIVPIDARVPEQCIRTLYSMIKK